jgi:hypothetical protein
MADNIEAADEILRCRIKSVDAAIAEFPVMATDSKLQERLTRARATREAASKEKSKLIFYRVKYADGGLQSAITLEEKRREVSSRSGFPLKRIKRSIAELPAGDCPNSPGSSTASL